MAKYQKYAEYKDSGVEWLGDIPKHWQTVSLKMLIDVRDGTHDTPPYVEPNFNTYPLVTSKDVTGGRVDLSNCKHISELDYSNIIKRSGVSKGDILMPMIGTVGSPVLVEDKFEIAIKNLALFKTSIGNEKLDSKFLFYFLNSTECETQFSLEGKGGVQNFVSLGTLRNLVLPLTKTSEQIKIANFLDHETTKIDHLIEKQKQLIELLKEKRQAVISHAVTKGLNPNVKMKDSGMEWLGEVPEHWDIVQAKYIADITRGAILRPVDAPEYFDEEGEWAYLNISDATKCDKYLDESKLRLSQLGSTKSARVYPNNLIITASATIGKAFINRIKVCVHDGFIPFCNIKLDINYLYHYVSNPYLYAAMGKSNTQKNIYLDEVKNMMVTVPPRCEQVAIVKHIESSQFKYDGLIQSANSAIKLMQERRTALISAAVTGKIDFRHWQAPTLAEADTELSA